MSFDFNSGVEENVVVNGGGKVKNEVLATAGEHMARIRSIVHIGRVEGFYEGKSNGIDPMCVVVFELKEEGDLETDGETPLVMTKDIKIKRGDKSNVALLCNAFTKDDGTQASNFDELIGCAGTVTVTHSKCGKYANIAAFNKGGVSSLHPKMKQLCDPVVGGVGNVKFSELTLEAMEELHAWNHVADLLVKGEDYEGSRAEALVAEIRSQEGRETYGTKVKSEKKKTDEPKAAPQLDEDAEY